jgi:hypothetical protein
MGGLGFHLHHILALRTNRFGDASLFGRESSRCYQRMVQFSLIQSGFVSFSSLIQAVHAARQ